MLNWLKRNGSKSETSNSGNCSSGEPLIHLRQVVKKYESLAGEVVALKGIDFQVKPGRVCRRDRQVGRWQDHARQHDDGH